MSSLHDIHTDKEKLLKQVKYLEENEKIDNEIKKARCPVCGGKIEYIMYEGGGDSIVIPYRGVVKCTRCDMFKKEIKRNNQESYRWVHDGSCEIALKRETWNAVRSYVKMDGEDKIDEENKEEYKCGKKPGECNLNHPCDECLLNKPNIIHIPVPSCVLNKCK